MTACEGDVATNTSNNTSANRVTNTQVNTTNRSNTTTTNTVFSNSSANTNKIRPRPPLATPGQIPPSPELSEKRDEGLFSFPPPRVTGYAALDPAEFMNPQGPTDFSYVADKLAQGLKRAGYPEDRYKFFWNDRNEFAIVTAMERVSEDGTPIGTSPEGGTSANIAERWNATPAFPRARGGSEYIGYLFRGKRVFYRVFAFVVTPRKYRRNFYSNSPPDFEMAVNWMAKGDSQLGDGGPTSVEFVPFTDEYSCYALLYLFVNHTSLDSPKSVDSLTGDDEPELKQGLDITTENHLRRSRIRFGEDR